MLMKVHNLMEEYVFQIVNELYDKLAENNAPWLTCNCESCKLDATSYVLNRIEPHYIVSGRGVVYTSQLLNQSQLKADVNALSMEAIRIISSTKRPYHKEITKELKKEIKKDDSCYFNFPIFSGTVYNGSTFEVLPNVTITLKDNDNNIIAMQDFSWENPCKTYSSTKGSFSFWPHSIKADKINENKKFEFILETSCEGFTNTTCGFDITLVSEDTKKTNIASTVTLKLKDIFMF